MSRVELLLSAYSIRVLSACKAKATELRRVCRLPLS